jgi:hypothetical protein
MGEREFTGFTCLTMYNRPTSFFSFVVFKNDTFLDLIVTYAT